MKADMIIDPVERNYNRVQMIPYLRNDKTWGEFPAAKRGNSTYARRNENLLSIYKKGLLHGMKNNSVLFLTLVVPCDMTIYGCLKSWKAISKAIGQFIKALRKKGIEKYIAVLEGTGEGNCHCHLLTRWSRDMQVSVQDNKYYLAEKELVKTIRERWAKEWAKVSELKLNNHSVSIKVCPNLQQAKNVFNYITKFLGMGSNIANSLWRAKINKATLSDLSKLFSNYWAYRLNIRLYRASRNLKKDGAFV